MSRLSKIAKAARQRRSHRIHAIVNHMVQRLQHPKPVAIRGDKNLTPKRRATAIKREQ